MTERNSDVHGAGAGCGDATEILEPRPKLKPPQMYKVLLLNDDHTPQVFVVQLLKRLFGMPHDKAVKVMLTVHTCGSGLCGVFTHEIAETKVHDVRRHARRHQYPLRCMMEPE